jgi:hypothetical protein
MKNSNDPIWNRSRDLPSRPCCNNNAYTADNSPEEGSFLSQLAGQITSYIEHRLTGLQLVKKSPYFMQPEVQYLFHKSPPITPLRCQTNPIQPPPPPPYSMSLIYRLMFSSHLPLGLPSGLVVSHFPKRFSYATGLKLLRIGDHEDCGVGCCLAAL